MIRRESFVFVPKVLAIFGARGALLLAKSSNAVEQASGSHKVPTAAVYEINVSGRKRA